MLWVSLTVDCENHFLYCANPCSALGPSSMKLPSRHYYDSVFTICEHQEGSPSWHM